MDGFSWLARVACGRQLREAPPPAPGLRVAFITTFVPERRADQPAHQSLPAMLEADYPHDTWVLDEGGDPEVRDLCERMGVRYFSRARHPQVQPGRRPVHR